MSCCTFGLPYGPNRSPDTQKEREAAQNNLGRVIEDYRKRFSSFAPSAPESYSHEISKVVQTLLPAWLQFRNTFVPLKKEREKGGVRVMSTDKTTQAKQAAMEALQKINAVEGFDPSALAVEYTDLNSAGGGDKRLPVMTQIGWFRLKYPEGRIAGLRCAGEGLLCGHGPGLSPLFRSG